MMKWVRSGIEVMYCMAHTVGHTIRYFSNSAFRETGTLGEICPKSLAVQ